MAALLGLGGAAAASADEAAPVAQIDSVQTRGDTVRVLLNLPDLPAGVTPDLDTLDVEVGGQSVTASADLASDAAEQDTIQRTTVLAIDASDSMRGDRFAAAKEAARAFIEAAPDDVAIGMVSFSGAVREVQAPTTDHAAVLAAVDTLSLDNGTLLYQGIERAVEVAGSEGSRSVLVLSDGRDTTDSPIGPLLTAVERSQVRLDVVSLELGGDQLAVLGDLADAAGGDVVTADDPTALTRLFTDQAAVLDSQVLATFAVPDGLDGGDETLAVSIDAGGQTYADEALVSLPAASEPTAVPTTPLPVDGPGLVLGSSYLVGGVAVLAAALLLLALLLLGVLDVRTPVTVDDRLSPYGPDGRRGGSRGAHVPPAASVGFKRQAVDLAGRALSGGVQSKLAGRLDAAGMKLTAAEWVLASAGVAVGAAMAGFLLSGGGLLLAAVMFLVGGVLPWLYLNRKRSKRLEAFDGQLADTLQLISGSLSAGLSFTQSLDTVVREGSEPVSGEFRRALVEQRLGVDVEEALEGVSQRMESDDFAWVVMAIRIQRQVGGNLAELLLTVAGTLREREYLRRQVSVLSAEGRFSAWILGGLPPAFVTYLLLARPSYLAPMWEMKLGWMMSAVATVLMIVGVFWMKQSIKVEV